MAGRPYLRAPDGTCFVPARKRGERTYQWANLIAELAAKSNGQRDSFRPAGRAAYFAKLPISQALANIRPAGARLAKPFTRLGRGVSCSPRSFF